MKFSFSTISIMFASLTLVAATAHSAVSTFSEGIAIGGTSLSSGLLLDVNGRIGATEFCDESGGGCAPAGSIGSVWGTSGADISNINTGNVGIGVPSPLHKLHVNGNIRTNGRHIYLGSTQDIYGDNSSALFFDSNHSTVTQFTLRDAQDLVYGRLRGDTDGLNFGLQDGDGNWSYLAQKDTQTDFRINNVRQLRLESSGAALFGSNSAVQINQGAGNTAVGPDLKMTGSGLISADSVLYIAMDANNDSTNHGVRFVVDGDTSAAAQVAEITETGQFAGSAFCSQDKSVCLDPDDITWISANVDEDSYGADDYYLYWDTDSHTAAYAAGETDTCNGDEISTYTCGITTIASSCKDTWLTRDHRSTNDDEYRYYRRYITCQHRQNLWN